MNAIEQELISDLNVTMNLSERLMGLAKQGLNSTGDFLRECVDKGQEVWDKNEPTVSEAIANMCNLATEFFGSSYESAKQSAQGLVDSVYYSSEKLNRLQKYILFQGGYYRELNRSKRATDCLMLGGESVATLAVSLDIPAHIEAAYQAAYPNLAADTTLQSKLSDIDGNELLGLLSGIKGKLFEQQYADYLNSGILPDSYRAYLAEAVNQPGWDLRIEGPNNEITELLQAKATDSVGYVVGALEKSPDIDIVTTEEVYAHLVMSGVSEGIVNSGISNASLEAALNQAVDSSHIGFDFSPPWFTLALIAFTTYKDESLTLFQKARSVGDRSGKSYLSYLVGGLLGAVTNTWWLGLVGTVGSRFIADEGERRRAIFKKMQDVAKANDAIIERTRNLRGKPAVL